MPVGDHLVLPNEDAFTLPHGWRKQIVPRRGRRAGSEFTPSPAAALSVPKNKAFAEMLDHPDSDPELVAAARQALQDRGHTTPLGAMVLLLANIQLDGFQTPKCQAEFDYWVVSRGLPFAACMLMELPNLVIAGNFFQERFRGFTLRQRSQSSTGASFIGESRRQALALHLRMHLTHASDREYAEACAAVAGYRERTRDTQVMASFLFPTQTEWVDAACEALAAAPDPTLARLLWCSAGSAAQLRRLAEHLDPRQVVEHVEAFATGLDAVGPASTPLLFSWLDELTGGDKAGDRLLAALSRIPTDEAMRGLVIRLEQPRVRSAFLKAQKRFPVRALRMLAEAAAEETAVGQVAGPLLRAQVSGSPELVAAALPMMPSDAAAYLEQVAAEVDRAQGGEPDLPYAPAESLPPVLVTPPWLEKRSTVVDLTPPEGTELLWQPGEREDWLKNGHWDDHQHWEQYAEKYRAGTLHWHHEADLFINAPDDIPRDWVTNWRPRDSSDVEWWLPRFVARYEQDALPVLMLAATKKPAGAASFLLPFANLEIATRMADWLSRTRTVRPTALAWLRRHPAFAARALIPAALGKPGRRRGAAEQAIHSLAATHRDEVLAAAKEYGQEALTEVESLLTVDQRSLLPAQIPALPAWVDPALLPPVRLREVTVALPPEAVRHLCTMLAMSTVQEPYAGVPLVKEACDPASLAEFGWALFEQWQSVGMPSKERWALTALAWVGDDQTVHQLAPLVRDWPGQGGHARAVIGLDVLAGIGTEAALRELSGISWEIPYKGLRERAAQKVAEAAAGIGLTSQQLEDRLVPDLGLDKRGSLTLDYGPRRFTVGFDEQLKPYVLDEAGARRKALPKPGSRDDAQLAPAAYQRFTTLKKEVRALATSQITRLEQAMVNQRRWSLAEFRQLLVEHPLVGHIVRRLVWACFDDQAVTAFRVAEDRSLADADDAALLLDDEATVGVAHPIHLGPAVPAWSEIFADYELLQPFPQLGREVHTLTEPEQQAETLDRFHGMMVPTGKLRGLQRRGWQRATLQDGEVQPWLLRPLPDGGAVVVNIESDIAIGLPDMFPEQQLTEIWIDEHGLGDWQQRSGRRFGELDPVIVSELLRELTEVTRD